MNGWGPDGAWWRRGVLTASLFLTGGSLCAAETSAPVSAPPDTAPNAPAPAAPGASIGAAKRDFDAINATRDPAQQERGTNPKFALPQLQTDPSESRPWVSPKALKSPDEAKRSSNWLVDAMEQERRPKIDRERAGRGTRRESDWAPRQRDEAASPDGVLASRGEADAENLTRGENANVAAREARERSEKPAPANPLSRFLGDWMTPKDFAILKPGLEDALADRNGGSRNDTPSTAALLLPGPAAPDVFGFAGPAQTTRAAPATAKNPYLAENDAFGPSAAVMPVPAPMPPPASPSIIPSNSIGTTGSGSAPIPAVSPKIPDFAKPALDEKYFKQLKRF